MRPFKNGDRLIVVIKLLL